MQCVVNYGIPQSIQVQISAVVMKKLTVLRMRSMKPEDLLNGYSGV